MNPDVPKDLDLKTGLTPVFHSGLSPLAVQCKTRLCDHTNKTKPGIAPGTAGLQPAGLLLSYLVISPRRDLNPHHLDYKSNTLSVGATEANIRVAGLEPA